MRYPTDAKLLWEGKSQPVIQETPQAHKRSDEEDNAQASRPVGQDTGRDTEPEAVSQEPEWLNWDMENEF